MHGWINTCLVFIFIAFTAIPSYAQERKELEGKRKQLIKDIKATDKLLKETETNKQLTYERYLALKQQIKTRKELVGIIKKELEYIDGSIERTTEVIGLLEEDIERLKDDYSAMLRSAYMRKLMKTDLLFLFSSDDFNKTYKRWQYLKQYDKYRQHQADRIIATRESLERKIKLKEERKLQKEELLNNEKQQLSALQKELKKKDSLLQELKRNEKNLKASIKEKNAKHESLNIAIEGILEEGMVSNRTRTKPDSPSTPSVPGATKDFKSMKGKLPRPVQGTISGYFGKQAHPTIPDVMINNSGIDILCRKGSQAKAVHDGEVLAVRFVQGADYIVVVGHGEYYSLYSKLADHTVKKGDSVSKGDVIGNVATDKSSGKTELHFEIWRLQTRLNPQSWIR